MDYLRLYSLCEERLLNLAALTIRSLTRTVTIHSQESCQLSGIVLFQWFNENWTWQINQTVKESDGFQVNSGIPSKTVKFTDTHLVVLTFRSHFITGSDPSPFDDDSDLTVRPSICLPWCLRRGNSNRDCAFGDARYRTIGRDWRIRRLHGSAGLRPAVSAILRYAPTARC